MYAPLSNVKNLALSANIGRGRMWTNADNRIDQFEYIDSIDVICYTPARLQE